MRLLSTAPVGQMDRCRLIRNGASWSVLLDGTPFARRPIDDLLVGDRIEDVSSTTGRLLLRVVLSQGQMFRDAMPRLAAERRSGRYWLDARVSCPECGIAAVHPITVAEGQYADPQWPFERSCADCSHAWIQHGRTLVFEDLEALA